MKQRVKIFASVQGGEQLQPWINKFLETHKATRLHFWSVSYPPDSECGESIGNHYCAIEYEVEEEIQI